MNRTQIPHLSITSIISGVLCFALLLAANLPPEIIPAFAKGMHHAHQFALFLVGVLLVSWGMMGGFPLPRQIQPTQNKLLWGIVLFGLLVRVPNLENAVHTYVDEMHFAEPVVRLWDQPNVQILTHLNPIAAFTFIYPYMQLYSVELFGYSLAGMRMLSVFLGVLMIPAVYILGARLLNRRTGYLAAALLAAFPPHIHFSRLALNNIADPFFGIWSLALLVIAMQSSHPAQQRRWYALAGVCLGLTQYFYEGGRMVFPVLIVGWLLLTLLLGRCAQTSPTRGGLLRFWLAALLIALPTIGMLIFWQAPLTPRLVDQGVAGDFWREFLLGDNGGQQLLIYMEERFLPALAHILWQPDASRFFYGGETALILPPLVPFFLLGVLALLRRPQVAGLFLPWVLLVILGNSLIRENNWTSRFVVVLPALVMVIAAGVDAAWAGLAARLRGENAKRRLTFVVVDLLITVMMGQVIYYYALHLPVYNRQLRPDPDFIDAAYRTADLPDGARAYLLTDNLVLIYHLDTVLRLRESNNTLRVIHPFEFPYQQMNRLNTDAPTAFFIEDSDTAAYLNLRRAFGDALVRGEPSPYNVPADKQFILYWVKPE